MFGYFLKWIIQNDFTNGLLKRELTSVPLDRPDSERLLYTIKSGLKEAVEERILTPENINDSDFHFFESMKSRTAALVKILLPGPSDPVKGGNALSFKQGIV